MKKIITIYIVIITLFSCSKNEKPSFDLAIENITIYDVIKKNTFKNKTILINADTISLIIDNTQKFKAIKTINGNGKLITPGFIDTHTHLKDIFGDYENAPEYIEESYRELLAQTYLQYGTTTIVEMGQPEKWIDTSLTWQKNPLPEYPDIFITGGALISDEEREPYINHTEVINPEDAKKKVQEYAKKGIEHLKLYWRLQKPEMKAVIAEAKEKNMVINGHIDQNVVSIQSAIDLGVKNFEHLLSIPPSIITINNHWDSLNEKYDLVRIKTTHEYVAVMIFFFEYIKENPKYALRFEELLNKMSIENVSLSTTIHVMGSVAERTYFFTSLGSDIENQSLNMPNYKKERKEKLAKAFDSMMLMLKQIYDKGIRLRIGTDCRNGGKAMLSEMMLLHEANFSMEDILAIATINGAKAMKIDDQYGSIEIGKKANLVMFDKNPFEDYKNILSKKTVIKSGKEFTMKDLKVNIKRKKSVGKEFLKEIQENGIDSALSNIQEKINAKDFHPVKENEINSIGYDFIGKNKIIEAIKIFKLNTKFFPNSGNAFDSLGEAYLMNNNQSLALESYEKAIELNPSNKNALEVLKKIKEAK